ncbi:MULTISPECIES: dicarboxylate/amino acid:cation symporter [Paraburkholderia]|jgi:aerobic C4-dicarboxylate transport protein|uniref:C4-dicarboxylate transport protein n=7 Tax=Paraburkholderia hospita TaxID=169430 RepID=A0AAN1JB57_9BURK|nr:dicarboxylate/amino acid:cation symporter [Paraburkholderia hospita]SOE85370.1 aerobic C4-dicarboxylate transport protein [Burkholderia sp. YR290]AUT70606.1 dicarboxylate/amino acid:cation symporter [Paraburkholderia hospita]EIM97795.1 C4-dicarboxylate transporter DctA [Paraburkholderia hospita]SEI25384.1 aerobic C4-dicarboxylate transport protein [Paraburkholderia hospita]SKC88129.1 aerobic C4-dicarboxylate transport protein [Paraburkholderia hospita]
MAAHKPLYRSLYFQVIVAIIAGMLLGFFAPHTGEAMKPLGDAFIKLIKMIIAPIIFCTVVVGIAGMEDMKKVGKTGGLALLYFEIVSGLALVVGLLIVNVVQPGAGMNVDPKTLDAKAVATVTSGRKMESTTEFLMNIIPSTVVDAFAKGEILQVLLFALMFGFALHWFGGRGTLIFDFVEKISHVFFRIVGIIMKVAPIGAFGAMAFTIGKYGIGSMLSLGKLMLTFYATCLLFVFVVLGLIAWFHGFSVWKLIKYLKEELFIVLGTSSSEAALPRVMVKLENLGAKKSVVGLVIPTGYSFNLDGTSIYLTLAAIFIAQATNTPLDLTHQLTLLAVLLLTSKGAAGVTGSGFIVLAATLSAVGHVPVAGLALILGIDRFMSEARALTNFIGNAVATLVVAKWTNELDQPRMRRVLDNETPEEADEPEKVFDRTDETMPIATAGARSPNV